MKWFFSLASLLGSFLLFLATAPTALGQSTDVLTYHNDIGRTGQNLNEPILSPVNVTNTHFGLLWTLPADGLVDAEPLYTAGVNIPFHGWRNVLYVATENDSLYAYDADSTNLFWRVSLIPTNEMPSDDRGCSQVSPQIGITSTPVIDRQRGPNGTIFVVAMTVSTVTNSYFQRLYALDLATGTNLVPPVIITAQYPGTGDDSDGTNVYFDPAQYKERAGLLLLNGVVYLSWASHCDDRPYTGWIMGYDEHTLAQISVLNVTPNGNEGAIWQAGNGLAADISSNIYFLDANGSFDATLSNGFPNQGDYGNAFMKLSTTNNQLAVADYFEMHNQSDENSHDTDLGSGGALVLPPMVDSSGHTHELIVGAGKDANIYLVDSTNMGKFNPNNDNAIYQEKNNLLSGGVWSSPAYFNGVLYYGSSGYYLQAFPFSQAMLGSRSSRSAITFTYPGTTPSISASGTSNGIVWATENTSPAILHAYAATNLTKEYYNSGQAAGGRDDFGSGNKFITPMIASARVYVATENDVGVLGLLDTSTLTPVEIWRNTYFHNPSNVGGGANGASPAGDGVPNLIKYALGLNPTAVVTRAQLPAGNLQISAGQNYLTLTVNRLADPADVTYIVEVSSNILSGWVSGGANTVTLTNTASQLVVRDNVPVPAATERFIRLRVTNP